MDGSETGESEEGVSANNDTKSLDDTRDAEARSESGASDDTDEDDDAYRNPWKHILTRVFEKLSEMPDVQGKTAAEVLKTPGLRDLIVQHVVEELVYIRMGNDGLEDDEVFQKITKTMDKLIKEEDYTKIEAIEEAARRRTRPLFEAVEDNIDLLKEDLEDQNENHNSPEGTHATDMPQV